MFPKQAKRRSVDSAGSTCQASGWSRCRLPRRRACRAAQAALARGDRVAAGRCVDGEGGLELAVGAYRNPSRDGLVAERDRDWRAAGRAEIAAVRGHLLPDRDSRGVELQVGSGSRGDDGAQVHQKSSQSRKSGQAGVSHNDATHAGRRR